LRSDCIPAAVSGAGSVTPGRMAIYFEEKNLYLKNGSARPIHTPEVGKQART